MKLFAKLECQTGDGDTVTLSAPEETTDMSGVVNVEMDSTDKIVYVDLEELMKALVALKLAEKVKVGTGPAAYIVY